MTFLQPPRLHSLFTDLCKLYLNMMFIHSSLSASAVLHSGFLSFPFFLFLPVITSYGV